MNESSPNPSHATRTGSATVEITCPAWCGVSAQEHAPGSGTTKVAASTTPRSPSPTPRASSWGRTRQPRYCEPIELVLLVTTDPTGREVESAEVLINGQESNLDQLALLANAIVDLGQLYRTTPGRRNVF